MRPGQKFIIQKGGCGVCLCVGEVLIYLVAFVAFERCERKTIHQTAVRTLPTGLE